MESEPTRDLSEAFPNHLRPTVRTVLGMLPDGTHVQSSPDDIGVITLSGDRLRIPARIYDPEPDWSLVRSLGSVEQSIVACLYTRHHDGHVRERALTHISRFDEAWVAPFIIQLLGEYVIELIEQVASLLEKHVMPSYIPFVRENPAFLKLTTDRATSYWNEYYRQRFRRREDYPAVRALAALTTWH
jgi:hypothetical protein